MSRYKPYLIFVAILAIGVGAIIVIAEGEYPVAIVGTSVISAKTFNDEYRAASFYYINALKVYGTALTSTAPLTDAEIQASVMNQIIENQIIRDEAQKEMGSGLGAMIQGKVGAYANDVDLAKAGSAVYGLAPQALMADVLVPEATREILQGQLLLEGETIDSWLADAKKSERVIIFSSQLKWDGSQVVSN
ncbi:MAG TPA: hypothetical protein VNG29_01405 [Candidatus Paceibacterota bacterium]|nr:hypothetical protein [Candidatus Paceibacterota bacterium]